MLAQTEGGQCDETPGGDNHVKMEADLREPSTSQGTWGTAVTARS